MYKATICKSLRDEISGVFQSVGMKLTSFDALEDDYTILYILRTSSWDLSGLEALWFWDRMREVLPDAECLCSQAGANAFIIYRGDL